MIYINPFCKPFSERFAKFLPFFFTVLVELWEKKGETILQRKVEFDEVYVIAGHKGHPEEVLKQSRKGHCRLKGARGLEHLKRKSLLFLE